MEGAAVTAGGGLKFNFLQFGVNLVVIVVVILLLPRILRFNLVDSAGNTTASLKPELNIA